MKLQLTAAPWSILITNLLLGAVMAALALWAKRAPLAAAVVAAATYAVVVVLSALVDPLSIAQGMAMKIFIVMMLFRSIKSGLALRTASA